MDGTASTEHGTSQRVTVAEAAAILGVSVVTIRRMIKRGQLEGERVHRPQGSAYLVTLPPDASPQPDDGTATERPAQNVSRTEGTPTALMTAWSEAFLAPLVTRLAEQETTIRDQAETIGRQGAELEGAQAGLERADAMLARQVAEQARLERRARLLSIALAVAGTLAIVGVLAPGWVR